MITGLTVILLLVLFLPFTLRLVEKNLEVFLFIMGLLAAWISQQLNGDLFITAFKDPIHITSAVLIAGLLFRWLQNPIERGILDLSKAMPFRLFLAVSVIFLGLISSIITAIIAAIVLVVLISVLKLERKYELRLVVLACFSIGMGAALTPIGEPLSTITTSKVNADFFYLLRLIGRDVIPAIILFGVLASIVVKPNIKQTNDTLASKKESYLQIVIRSVKIYLFVMGLTLLGAGFEPFIEEFLLGLSPYVLYWINMISAILDNATLASAEISPAMDEPTIRAILLGLIISGGMLIPGNIPNIIAAGKLNITSTEWARFGVPVGLIAMAVYFVVILLF